MEILSAGAFINLENQEKIEQLKFTAAELANAAIETTGFVNSEESGKNLALEFWQGLEYMSRETEEATIKNIFLNHFLDRLRNARPIQTVTAIELSPDSAPSDFMPIENEEKLEDEFLGVIETATVEENSIEETVVETEENLTQTVEFSATENDSVQETEVKTIENVSTDSVEEKLHQQVKSKTKLNLRPKV
jgi:hypothetical protein